MMPPGCSPYAITCRVALFVLFCFLVCLFSWNKRGEHHNCVCVVNQIGNGVLVLSLPRRPLPNLYTRFPHSYAGFRMGCFSHFGQMSYLCLMTPTLVFEEILSVLRAQKQQSFAFLSETRSLNASFWHILNVHLLSRLFFSPSFYFFVPMNRNPQERDLATGGGHQRARAAQEAHGPEAENEGSQPRLWATAQTQPRGLHRGQWWAKIQLISFIACLVILMPCWSHHIWGAEMSQCFHKCIWKRKGSILRPDSRLWTVPPSLMAPFVPSVLHSAEFREPRVIELWEAAKRANLSEDELDSLKVIPPDRTSLPTNLCFRRFVTHRLKITLKNFVLLLLKGPLIPVLCS